jgi:flagellar assembly protein FliH
MPSEARHAPRSGEPTPAAEHPQESPEQIRIRELEGNIRILERRLEDERKTAREQGHQQGLAAGAQQEAAKWTEALARLGRAIEEMSKAKPRFRAEVEEDAVKLALAIARKVLNREMMTDPEALVGLARVALSKLNVRELQRVRVHPADVAAIERLLVATSGPQRVQVIGDTTLERGGAIFETERGALDASVTTQLGEIERGLTDMLGTPR